MSISAGNWKQGPYNHRHSFSNLQLINQTAQSKYFWNLKDQRLTPQIKWKIVKQSTPQIASMADITCVSMKKLV